MTKTTAESFSISAFARIVKRAVRHETGLVQDLNDMRVDCFYETFRVNTEQAMLGREEFMELLGRFGETFSDESLRRGIAYERIKGLLPASAVSMFEFIAFGKALGLWEIVTPKEKRRNPALRRIVFEQAEVGSIGIVRL